MASARPPCVVEIRANRSADPACGTIFFKHMNKLALRAESNRPRPRRTETIKKFLFFFIYDGGETPSGIAMLTFCDGEESSTRTIWEINMWRLLSAAAAVVVTSALLLGATTLEAQQPQKLIPYFGETKAEFEARKAGLSKPSAPPDASSVTIRSDVKGNYVVQTTVNNIPVAMVVDTGANVIALTEKDAQNVGLAVSPADYKAKILTANGSALGAPVLLSKVAVGDIEVDNVEAVVVPEDKLPISLLGMSFLSKLSYLHESGGTLTLKH